MKSLLPAGEPRQYRHRGEDSLVPTGVRERLAAGTRPSPPHQYHSQSASKSKPQDGPHSPALPCLTVWILLLALLCGCASPHATTPSRPFEFSRDTLAYPNELKWVYEYDAKGGWTTRAREPKPTYALHCCVVARSARQFFENARFDPHQPVADAATYRRLIRQVVSTSPRHPLPESQKIIIPGYPDLRGFSQAQEKLLKAECGGASASYFQRGNWRMIFPFSRHQQQTVADQLLTRLKSRPAIVHLVRFPRLTINHTVLIFDARQTPKTIEFITYDPNQPAQPITLTFERSTRTFLLPANSYFPGGRVDVYETYYKWNY